MLTKEESIRFLESLVGSASVTIAANSAIYWIKNPETYHNPEKIKKLKAKIQRYTHTWSELKKAIEFEASGCSGAMNSARTVQGIMTQLENERDDTPNRPLPPKVFWLVWCEQKAAPTHKHLTEPSARTEAERLAKAYPGRQFHVLQLLGSCTFAGVDWSDQDEIPF